MTDETSLFSRHALIDMTQTNVQLKETEVGKMIDYFDRLSERAMEASNLTKWLNSDDGQSSIKHVNFLHDAIRENLPNFESIEIPAPPKPVINKELLRHLSELPPWAHQAFPGVQNFNPMQSVVFDGVFGTRRNVLVSAPTGAGKTNIAMLAIIKEIEDHRTTDGRIKSASEWKVVYIAPMKALVAEIVEKFSKSLSGLGIRVKELTADMQLTRKELLSVHVIVTVPEKWDIITRNSLSAGSTQSQSIQTVVSCLIIDEVHLLNADRGPVIETIVARTMRHDEGAQRLTRIVALSATLPNWDDVAKFLRVPKERLYHFDESFRPVPLKKKFIGVKGNSNEVRLKMDEICLKVALESLNEGHQSMIFVYSRVETTKYANFVVEQMQDLNLYKKDIHPSKLQKCRDPHLRSAIKNGVAWHHAGMIRQDRDLVEDLFRNGNIRLLVCTGTLAWGVNLPARQVIIKGTKIFDSKGGGFRNIDILDVFQIFGRAGRPQYDTEGSAVLITEHGELNNFVRLLCHQHPIESQFIDEIPNALNAEISTGSITNLQEAIEWFGFTYLSVRMPKNPILYGIDFKDVLRSEDPSLVYRDQITLFIKQAAEKLNDCRLIRLGTVFDTFSSTDAGRISSKFYVDYRSAGHFLQRLSPDTTDEGILELLSSAKEFENLQVRKEEVDELMFMKAQLKNVTGIAMGDPASQETKISILIQCFLARQQVRMQSLISDFNYVSQNAPRLVRALFELSLTRSFELSETTCALLEWTKMLDRRLLGNQSVLRHFCYPSVFSDKKDYKFSLLDRDKKHHTTTLDPARVERIEKKNLSIEQLQEMTLAEISSIVSSKSAAVDIKSCLRNVPSLLLNVGVQTVTPAVIRIIVTIEPTFQWKDRYSDLMEPFYIFVQNPDTDKISHFEEFVLHKKHLVGNETSDSLRVSIVMPLDDPPPHQYNVALISQRWVDLRFDCPFRPPTVLPDLRRGHTDLLSLDPLPIKALGDENLTKIYSFPFFNPIQTQLFHTVYHTDYNVLLGAPTGSGKTAVAEMAIFRSLRNRPGDKTVYIAPLKALARERMQDWKARLQNLLGLQIAELTGDHTPDIEALHAADVLITTPEKWDGVSRFWQTRSYVKKVTLMIIDEIHLLGLDRGPVLEVIVSRMRFISSQLNRSIRFVGLSTALANAHDVADWLGVGRHGLFNFRPSVRPVPCTVYITGFTGDHYCPRMNSMNRPAFAQIKRFSLDRPVLVFVSSRRQTRLTAKELIALCAADASSAAFVNFESNEELERTTGMISDSTLKSCVEFGIGMHHAGLSPKDKDIVTELFVREKIRVLVCTSTLAWGVNLPAHLVIVKGTEYYEASKKGYEDFPITDLLQMIGRAGRPQFDTSATACVFVHESKRNFYRRFLYEPFPVESSLHKHLPDHINAEIANGAITTFRDVVDYLSWTYLFRRLHSNPSYYDPSFDTQSDLTQMKEGEILAFREKHKEMFIEKLILSTLHDLEANKCIEICQVPENILDKENGGPFLKSTPLGKTSALYYLKNETAAQFVDTIFEKPLGLVDMMRLIADSKEYEELPVRHNEDKLNEEFSVMCPLQFDNMDFESPHTKALLLFQAHMFNLELPIVDYYTDTKSVLDQSVRLIQGILDIAVEQGKMSTFLSAVSILQCLAQATHPFRSSLYSIRHIGDQDVKRLLAQDVSCLGDLIESDGEPIKKLYMSPKLKETVIQYLRKIPRLRVKVLLERQIVNSEEKSHEDPQSVQFMPALLNGEIVTPGSYLMISTRLSYVNNIPEKAFVSPQAKSKPPGWIVLVGDLQNDEAIASKRISLKKQLESKGRFATGRTSFKFKAPTEEGYFTLSVIFLSDCYVGIDQQHDIKLLVKK
eukprot:GHVP01056616.1.p1 GENE.GHVP01056616.1~~GHVP01056616.1.p1  ORF type:complete len:2004 (+),score=344.28 GHVP01056616.1:435-6014(+)